MEPKILKNIFKKKLHNHIVVHGKKETTERIVTRSMKQIQKSQKKNSDALISLSVLNVVPIFRTIKLTNKKRRKKDIKKVPGFLSKDKHRLSQGIKDFVQQTVTSENTKCLSLKLTNGLLTDSSVKHKIVRQKEALENKKLLKFYLW